MDSIIQHIHQHIGKPAACAHCATPVHSGFGSCQHCPTVLYCGAACQQMDWKNGHFAACGGRPDGESDRKKLKKTESIDYVDIPADLKALLLHYLSLGDLKSAVHLSEVNKAYTRVFRERFVTEFSFRFRTNEYKDDAFRALAPFIKNIIIPDMDIFDYAKDMSFAPTFVHIQFQTPLDLRILPTSTRGLWLEFTRNFAFDNNVNYITRAPEQVQHLVFDINPVSFVNFTICKIHYLEFRFAGHVPPGASFAWPSTLEWLKISSTDGLPLERIAYPPNLKRLSINELDHDIDNLPLRLEYLDILELNDYYVMLPETLRHLRLNDGIDFQVIQWPPNLETLDYGGTLSTELYKALPQSISKLRIEIDDNARLNKWPSMLKQLLFNSVPSNRLENLPPGLEVIGFLLGNLHHNQDYVIDYLPLNLKELHISDEVAEYANITVPPNTKLYADSSEWFSDQFPEIDY